MTFTDSPSTPSPLSPPQQTSRRAAGPAPRSAGPRPQRVIFLVTALLAFTAFAWLCSRADPAHWRRLAESLQSPALLLVLAGLVASQLLRAARLHSEWRNHVGAGAAGYRECLALFLVHNAAVVWLPMRSGEAGYLWWLHRRWRVPVAEALGSLLWLRLQDALVLLLISLGVAAVGWRLAPAPVVVAMVAAVFAVSVLAAGRAVAAAGSQADGQTDPAAAPAPAWASGWMHRRVTRPLVGALRQARGGRQGWFYCAANWLVKLAVLGGWLAMTAPLDASTALMGVTAGEWAAVLPVQAPGGFGGYEAAVWLGVEAAGAPAAAGSGPFAVLQAALLLHGLALLVATAGALAVGLVALGQRWLADAAAQPSPDAVA